MLRKFKRFYFLILFFFQTILSPAFASVLVNQPAPYLRHDMGATSVILYYAAAPGGVLTSGAFVDTHAGYRLINTSALSTSTHFITVDVSTDKAFTAISGKPDLVVTISTSTTSGSEVPIQGAVVVSSSADTSGPSMNCGSTGACSGFSSGAYHSATYTPGTVLRLTISLADLCTITGASGAAFCTGLATINSTLTQSLVATVGLTASGAVGPVASASTATDSAEAVSFSLSLTALNPTLSTAPADACPSEMLDPNFYFPGDTEIILNTGLYGGAAGSGAPIQSYLLLAKRAGSAVLVDGTDTPYTSNDIVAYVNASAGSPRVSGFVNSDSATDASNYYEGAVYAISQAGIISLGCAGSDTTNKIRAQPISGILTESKCFIATAAYHDGRAYPVMLLRQFRDQILSRFDLGKAFIHFYYDVSPKLAMWAWHKPWVRLLALKYLTPLEVFSFLVTDANAEEIKPSEQSYIDRIKKTLEPEIEDTSYIESLKKKLDEDSPKRETSHESYIDRIKKTSPDETPEEAGSFTEKEKIKLGKGEDDDVSLIDKVKSGDDQLHRKEKPPIRNAIAIKVGVSPGMKVVASGSAFTFENVYGTMWKPDVIFHYERQLFHNENFGSFGPTLDAGVSYVGAMGLLKFAFAGSNRSRTSFSFIQIPVLIGANYRFNLLRIVRPYVGVNGGVIGYDEIRNDHVKSKTGYSTVYSASAGVSFLLDFLDGATMRDAYDGAGFQHSYLFAEYVNLSTLSGSVKFSRSGVYSGFLFEF